MSKHNKQYIPKKGRNVARDYFVQGARVAGGDNFIASMLAGTAMTLKEYTNMSNDDIYYVMSKTAELFNDSYRQGYDLCRRCYDECDIDVNGEFSEKESI